MLNFNSIILFSENPDKLSEFYKKVFQKDPDMDDGSYRGFLIGNGFFTIGPHDKIHGKNLNSERIMFNFETVEVKEEAKRIRELGGRVVAKPYQMNKEQDMWIATFADPDDNYFQLISPWDSNKN